MAVPADGITLDDKRATTAAAAAGRRRHSRAEHRAQAPVGHQGRLARGARAAARAARSPSPTSSATTPASSRRVRRSRDASRFQDALDVLARFGGEARLPAGGRRASAAGRRGRDAAVPETPKPDDPRLGAREHRRSSARGATRWPARRPRPPRVGYHVLRLDDAGGRRGADQRRRRTCGPCWRARAGIGRPACIVSSGETTVHVTGGGKGGRNQEFALAAAAPARGARRAAPSSPASAPTASTARPTPPAPSPIRRRSPARGAAGLSPERHLADNNAYAFFDALGDLIHTGPTGTNVGDLQVILLA